MLTEEKDVISKFFSKRSNYWIELYSDEENPKNFMRYELASRKRIIFHFLNSISNSNKFKVLDIGCGIGNYMDEIVKHGNTVIGIDISYDMLLKSKQRLQSSLREPPVCLADIENLPFIKEQYDVIFCVGVLEYLRSDYKALNEISRILKKDGYLFLTLPNIFSLKNFFDPYYFFIRGWKYIFLRITGKQSKKKKIQPKDIGNNNSFTNKRYKLNTIKSLLFQNSLIRQEILNISFGPLSFWHKNYFSLTKSIKISEFLDKLSRKKLFSVLNYFADRWVFIIRKV